MIRPLRRSIYQYYAHNRVLPPTFLFPFQARLSTTAHTIDPEPLADAYHHTTPPAQDQITQNSQPVLSSPPPPPPRQPQLSRTSPLPPLAPDTTASLSLLPLLAAQKPHYITAHIHARPYLLTLGDNLRLPFLMPNAPVGSTLRLTRASVIGSRDYTYRGAPYVDERAFLCRATVVGVESEPMRFIEKTKRRQRHVKTAKSKGRFTVLRVSELEIRSSIPDEPEVKEIAADEEQIGAPQTLGPSRMQEDMVTTADS